MQDWIRAQPDFEDPSSSSSRLPALYADLAAHRTANRSSYDASISWWKRTLTQACLEGAQRQHGHSVTPQLRKASDKGKQAERSSSADRLVLHLDQQLLDDLTMEEVGRPLGLGTAVAELRDSRDLIRLSDFMAAKAPLQGPVQRPRSISAALAAVALSPITWAVSQVSSQLGLTSQDDDPGERDWKSAQGDWVIWENLRAVGDALLRLHHASPRLSPLECLYSRQALREELVEPALRSLSPSDAISKPDTLSDQDYTLLLKHLSRDRGVAIVDGSIIKLEHVEGQGLPRDTSISNAEKGIVNVKETHAQLEKQVAEIEQRIKERQARVEQCVRDKRKEQALSYLRSKKTLEELLQRRMGAQETLHGVLVKIEQAASDVEIMRAYEVSTSTLKTLLGDARLQPDRVDATMDAMQETIADADEVRTTIESGQEGMRRAAGIDVVLDEDEMAAELAALQREVEGEKQAEKMGKAESQATPAAAVKSHDEAQQATQSARADDAPAKVAEEQEEGASTPHKEAVAAQ